MQEEKTYLLEPTGDYCVGHQAITLAETKLPLQIYYPSGPSKPRVSTTNYYPEGIQRLQKDIRGCKIEGLTEAQIQSLGSLMSFAEKNLPILDTKFPVIYFSAGSDSNPQLYENILCDLASHGYIIVGLDNSEPNKTPQAAYAELMAAHLEIQTLTLHSQQNDIFSAMDLKHVGLLGHSLGGVAIILAAQQNPQLFQGMIALDAPAYLESKEVPTPPYDVRQACNVPSMQIHSSTWIYNYSAGIRTYEGVGQFPTGGYRYHVVLENEAGGLLYSDHNNFEDISTLQFHPAIQAFNRYLTALPSFREELKEKDMVGDNRLQLGLVDGCEIAETINQYIHDFYNRFLLLPLQQNRINTGMAKHMMHDIMGSKRDRQAQSSLLPACELSKPNAHEMSRSV